MKFFTREWLCGDMTDEQAGEIAAAYWRHIDKLDLPEPVRELAHLNPHDAYILDVEHEAAGRVLRLRLRCGDLPMGYFDALLSFSGVTIPSAHLARLVEARRPAEFEILYDEVDRADAGRFEYRLLLHPVGEVAILFEDAAIAKRPVAGRQAV